MLGRQESIENTSYGITFEELNLQETNSNHQKCHREACFLNEMHKSLADHFLRSLEECYEAIS